jgi:NTP pyrophosphatase (non-canonical NTP hydrolase)
VTFEEYAVAMNATKVYPTKVKVLYPALALAEEAGEVSSILAKHLRDRLPVVHGESGEEYLTAASFVLDEQERDKMLGELGDVLWQWAALCTDLGFSLDEVAQHNRAKLIDRKVRNVLHGSGSER